MTSKAFYLAAGVAFLAGGLFLRGTASQQGAPAPPSVTLLVTLGHKAEKGETWDGTARVSGGSVVSTEGRHFSAGDVNHAGDVAEDFRQLQVHLLQGLLHVLHVPAGLADQVGPLPQVGPQPAGLLIGPEGRRSRPTLCSR